MLTFGERQALLWATIDQLAVGAAILIVLSAFLWCLEREWCRHHAGKRPPHQIDQLLESARIAGEAAIAVAVLTSLVTVGCRLWLTLR